MRLYKKQKEQHIIQMYSYIQWHAIGLEHFVA